MPVTAWPPRALWQLALMAGAVDVDRCGDEFDRGACNPITDRAQRRSLRIGGVYFLVYRGLERGAAIEFAANFMGSVDKTRDVIGGGNLLLCEQRDELVLLALVGSCRAGANDRGGQRHPGANESDDEAGDAGAHGEIPVLRCHLLDVS